MIEKTNKEIRKQTEKKENRFNTLLKRKKCQQKTKTKNRKVN